MDSKKCKNSKLEDFIKKNS